MPAGSGPARQPALLLNPMNSYSSKMLRAGVKVEAALRWTMGKIERLYRSKAEIARRASGRMTALLRREQEAERLDRLRNPRNYQGR